MDAIFLFFEMQISGRAPSSSFCLLSLFFSGGKSKHSLEVNPLKTWHDVKPFSTRIQESNTRLDWHNKSLCLCD